MRMTGWLAVIALVAALGGCNQTTDNNGVKPAGATGTSGTNAPTPTPPGPDKTATTNGNPATHATGAKENPVTTPAKVDATKDGSASTEPPKRASLVLAGGCFWCVEAVFEELEGVIDAVSGYAGGTKETANYEAVCSGKTGHAEVVQIIYDPSKITPEKLLAVHFATHDPTTLNRQGADAGPQYRSAIFYASEEEKQQAQAMIDRLTEAKAFPRKIVTTLEPLTVFYVAERYHQNYACDNPFNGYVQNVALPKIEKVREKFKDDLKKEKGPVGKD